MSRLDDEYDAAARHDLAELRIDELARRHKDPYKWEAVCACGKLLPLQTSSGAARRCHEGHQTYEGTP